MTGVLSKLTSGSPSVMSNPHCALARSTMKSESNISIIGNLTRGRRTELGRYSIFDVLHSKEHDLFWEYRIIWRRICRLSRYPSLSPRWSQCDLYAGILAPRWRYIHGDGSVRLLAQSLREIARRLPRCFACFRCSAA